MKRNWADDACKIVTYHGEDRCLAEIFQEKGITDIQKKLARGKSVTCDIVFKRLEKGWTSDQAIDVPYEFNGIRPPEEVYYTNKEFEIINEHYWGVKNACAKISEIITNKIGDNFRIVFTTILNYKSNRRMSFQRAVDYYLTEKPPFYTPVSYVGNGLEVNFKSLREGCREMSKLTEVNLNPGRISDLMSSGLSFTEAVDYETGNKKHISSGERTVKAILLRYGMSEGTDFVFDKSIPYVLKKLGYTKEEEGEYIKKITKSTGLSVKDVRRYRFDFIIFDAKKKEITKVIEFDGTQHFVYSEKFHVKRSFEDSFMADSNKTNILQSIDIPLLRIRYDQVDKIEEMINDLNKNGRKYIRIHNPYIKDASEYYDLNYHYVASTVHHIACEQGSKEKLDRFMVRKAGDSEFHSECTWIACCLQAFKNGPDMFDFLDSKTIDSQFIPVDSAIVKKLYEMGLNECRSHTSTKYVTSSRNMCFA